MDDEEILIGMPALRLTFRIDGEQIEMIDRQQVSMNVLPSDPSGKAPRSGSWHEVQDDAGNVLYRHAMADPTAHQVEVPTGDAGQPLAWAQTGPGKRILSIVVPDLGEGRSLVFLSSRPEAARDALRAAPEVMEHMRAFEAQEVARFDLRQEE